MSRNYGEFSGNLAKIDNFTSRNFAKIQNNFAKFRVLLNFENAVSQPPYLPVLEISAQGRLTTMQV